MRAVTAAAASRPSAATVTRCPAVAQRGGDGGEHRPFFRVGGTDRGPAPAQDISGQIVRANGEEVDAARESGRGGCRRGEFHHHAERRRVHAGRPGRPREPGADKADSVERTDHRDHDRQVGARAGFQDGGELGTEGTGGVQEGGQACRARERRDLVPREVEQPHDRALAVQQAEDRALRASCCYQHGVINDGPGHRTGNISPLAVIAGFQQTGGPSRGDRTGES
jgi:hypothetical protein